MTLVNSSEIGPPSRFAPSSLGRHDMPTAGEKNPDRTYTDNTPISSVVAAFVEDESGHQKLTVDKLGVH
jgi:hypothetical protein